MRRPLVFGALCSAVAFSVGCDGEGQGKDSMTASEGSDAVPDQCPAPEIGDPDPAYDLCSQYYSVRGCCGTLGFSDAGPPVGPCSDSFTRLHFPTDLAPAACPELVEAAVQCAIDVGAESCEDMADFVAGVQSGVTSDSVGPPTDFGMPCYAEVVAAWDAGCEPFLY